MLFFPYQRVESNNRSCHGGIQTLFPLDHAPRRDVVLSNNHSRTYTTSAKYSLWDASILACLSEPLGWFKDWFCGEGPSPMNEQGLVINYIERKGPRAISSESATK